MICTAPCVPACTNEATHELLMPTGEHLGYNCASCIDWPSRKNVQTNKFDYATRPLETIDVTAPAISV